MTQNIKIPIRIINIEKQIENIKNWDIAEQDKKDIPKFLRDLQLGKLTGNQMNSGTLITYITNLKISLEYFKKPSSKLIEKDIDRLCEVLMKDELIWIFKKKNNESVTIKHNQPYSTSTKQKIKDSLIKYLEWKLGDKSIKFVKMLRVRPRLKETTPDFLKEEPVEKLYKSCKSAEERFLIAVLFDSGARAEEFHNIRREDIELPKGEGSYPKLILKEEYSKTKGRTIGLYWKYSFEAVRDYVEERIKEGLKEDEPIYKRNYRASRIFLHRLGLKVLGRSIHYHLFRHSSATYYASKLNRQQLCIRYGWRFRSPMPDRYINRDGLENKEIDEKFEKTDINELKDELEKVKQQNKIREDKLKQEVQAIMLKAKEELRKMLEQTGMLETIKVDTKS